MFPLPALPLVPKLHRFFEPEQARTFALVFGIALLGQFVLPWSGPGWFNFSAGTIWPLLVGVGFVVLSFVPGLADKLKPNLFFLIVAGAGVLGLLWSFAGAGVFVASIDPGAIKTLADAQAALGALSAPPFFWLFGVGIIGLATACAGLVLWARNGYSQLYWTLLMSGIIGIALGLLVPLGYGFPLVRIFTSIGDPAPHIIARLFGAIFALAFIGVIVLLVMNVFLKKEEADPIQVERFSAVLFLSAFVLPLVYGLISLTTFATMLHVMLTTAIFAWLTIWGMVCFFEAKAKGENLLSFS